MESYKVLRVGATEIAHHRDGLFVLDRIHVVMSKMGLFDRGKPPTPADYAITSQIKEFDAKLNSTSGFLWMVTGGNDRMTQMNAGRAYARLRLPRFRGRLRHSLAGPASAGAMSLGFFAS